MKKFLFLLLVMVAVNSAAQNQYELKDLDWIEICYNPKYAIVTLDGKKGIYDMVLHKNITEIDFRELAYSHQVEAEDSSDMSMFYAKKGIKRYIISVYEPTNDIFAIWMDDPDEVYSLEECTTIDKKITKRVKKLLEGFIKRHNMDNAQIVILDAMSGHLKTWVALDADMEKENAGKLLAHSCSASLAIPFREGHPLKNTQLNATSPFMMAAGYNSLAHNGAIILPTMLADSVNVEEGVFSSENIANLHKTLRVDKTQSPQLKWLLGDTEWYGYAATDNIYDDEDKERNTSIGKQIQFAGVFPVENPHYTICIVAEKYSLDVTLAAFQDVVNPLVKWLLKKK